MDLVKALSSQYMKEELPEMRVGDTVRVHVRIKEGSRERIQVFEGTVIARKNGGIGEQVYAMTKVGFNGSTVNVNPVDKNSRWQMPYSHAKAFLTHPFSVMRHFCGDITHIQCFMEKPGARKQSGDLMLSIASVNIKFQNGIQINRTSATFTSFFIITTEIIIISNVDNIGGTIS